MKRTSSLALSALMALITSSASAYELATHGVLTQKAYERSILTTDPRVLSDLGIDASNLNVFGEAYYDVSGAEIKERSQNDFEKGKMPNEGKEYLTVKGWLLRGAIREDDYATALGLWVAPNPKGDQDQPQAFWRVMNHFYDPVRNSPLTFTTAQAAAFTTATGESSANFRKTPDWAVGASDVFTQPNTLDAGRRNHFTVFDAREAMYRALTGKSKDNTDVAATKDERNKYWATTFRALGDIVHLVEDMAQPQHTRNALHAINLSSARSPA